MAYRKVYFRIRTDCYNYNSGWSSDADRSAFKEESCRLFQELESKRDEITGYILEKCRTKRSNLYIVAPIAIHVAEHFEIRSFLLAMMLCALCVTRGSAGANGSLGTLKIHTLEAGDTVTLTTVLGTRTWADHHPAINRKNLYKKKTRRSGHER